jgi:hypothetical protein
MRRRRPVAFAAGLGLAVVYLVAAVVSGRISPLARHPVLDGIGIPQPYHWVNPPPGQISGNQQPASKQATLDLTKDGGAGFVTTSDAQVNLIVGKNAFPPVAGQTSVRITIEPLDPAKLGPPPPGTTISGNAYKVSAAYQPSGKPVGYLSAPVTLILIYPAVASSGLTPPPRTIIRSFDGRSWQTQKTQDQHAGLQAIEETLHFGYFAVVTPPLRPVSAGTRLVAILVFAGIGLFALAGIAVIVRGLRRAAAAKEREWRTPTDRPPPRRRR